MKRITYFLIFIILLAKSIVNAQNIQISMSPHPSPYLSDWETHTETLVLIVNNTSGKDVDAKVKTQLFNGKDDVIAETDPGRMPVLTLPAGVSSYHPEDIYPINALKYDNSYKDKLLKTGRLPDDNYRLCVSLTDPKTGEALTAQQPQCKTFTIMAYQAPILLSPRDKDSVTIAQTKGFIFKWTPVAPLPSDVVTYHLQVWEILPGQDAMRSFLGNKPIVEKDIKGMTQASWPAEFELPREGMSYVWSIQAFDGEGRPLVDGGGRADPFSFQIVKLILHNPPPVLLSPRDKDTVTIGQIKGVLFKWTPIPDAVTYRFQLYKIMPGQDATKAFLENKPIVEAGDLPTPLCPYPLDLELPRPVIGYVWTVQALDAEGKPLANSKRAEPFSFWIKAVEGRNTAVPEIVLTSPTTGNPPKSNMPDFTWKTTGGSGVSYNLTLTRNWIAGDTDSNVMNVGGKIVGTKKIIFEQKGITGNVFHYPKEFPPLQKNIKYEWTVQALDVEGSLLGNGKSEPFGFGQRSVESDLVRVTVNDTEGFHIIDNCSLSFGFNVESNATNNYSLKVLDATLGNLTCPLPSTACHDTPTVMEFATTNASLTVNYDNNTGTAIAGSNTITGLTRLQCGHNYIVIVCINDTGLAGGVGPYFTCASFLFSTKCCNPCKCKGWKPVTVNYNGTDHIVACGGTINIPPNVNYSISTDDSCSRDSCMKTITAQLLKPGYQYEQIYKGNEFALNPITPSSPYMFDAGDSFKICFTGTCDKDTSCSSCCITVTRYPPPHRDSCKCNGLQPWQPVIVTYNGIDHKFKCGDTIHIPVNTGYTISTDLNCIANSFPARCDKHIDVNINSNNQSFLWYSGNGPFSGSGEATQPQKFDVCFKGSCNNYSECRSCCIHVIIDSEIVLPNLCSCLGYTPAMVTYNGIKHTVNCGDTIHLPVNVSYTISSDLFCFGLKCNKHIDAKIISTATNFTFYSGSGPAIFGPTTSTIPGKSFDVCFSGSCNNHTPCRGCCIHVIIDSATVKPNPCTCKGWEPLAVNTNGIKQTLKCGGTIHIPANVTSSFSTDLIFSSIKCIKTMSAKIVFPNGTAISVGAVNNSGISVPINSATAQSFDLCFYGDCNNYSSCVPCCIHIVIDSANCKCKGWKTKSGTYGNPLAKTKYDYKCGGGPYTLAAGTYTFNSPVYECTPPNCTPTYKWKIDGVWQINGPTVSLTFTPGNHQVSIHPYCGKDSCPPCEFKVIVTGKKCCPGKWGDKYFGTKPGSSSTILKCDQGYQVKCSTNYYISATYSCNDDPNCIGMVAYKVSPAGATITSSGMFNATVSGSYMITLYGICGKDTCDKCSFQFSVGQCKDCHCYKGPKGSGWSGNPVTFNNGRIQYDIACGSTSSFNFSQGTPYTFNSPAYMCSPNNKTCQPSYKWYVDGYFGGSGMQFTYAFVTAGAHTVTIAPFCGTDSCPACQFHVNVKKCSCQDSINNGIWNTSDTFTYIGPNGVSGTIGANITATTKLYISQGETYTFTCPPYPCISKGCSSLLLWSVYNFTTLGTGTSFTHTFTTLGVFTVHVQPVCGLDTCNRIIELEVVVNNCHCPSRGGWGGMDISYNGNGITGSLAFNQNTQLLAGTPFTFTSPVYYCQSNTSCAPVYSWSVNGTPLGTGQSFTHTFLPGNNYKVCIKITCGGHICDSCKFQVEGRSTNFIIGQNYGGGVIFYIDNSGQHGLIAAPVSQACDKPWGNYTGLQTGATGQAIGTGQANTADIIAVNGAGNYAANICHQLVLNGYSDWFLPSKDELNMLLLHKNEVGGWGCLDSYWSSTEYWGGYNLSAYVGLGILRMIQEHRGVRAIRKF